MLKEQDLIGRRKDSSDDAMHHGKNNCWTICNADNIYYTSNTLTIYKHQYYYFNLNCEWHKEWCFDSKKQMSIIESKAPIGIVGFQNTFNIIEKNSEVFIEINKKIEAIDKSLIVALNINYQDKEKKEKCYKRTPKNLKTGYNKNKRH